MDDAWASVNSLANPSPKVVIWNSFVAIISVFMWKSRQKYATDENQKKHRWEDKNQYSTLFFLLFFIIEWKTPELTRSWDIRKFRWKKIYAKKKVFTLVSAQLWKGKQKQNRVWLRNEDYGKFKLNETWKTICWEILRREFSMMNIHPPRFVSKSPPPYVSLAIWEL